MFFDLTLFLISFITLWIGAGIAITSVERVSRKVNISSFIVSFFALGVLTSLSEISDLTVEKALTYINAVKVLKESLTQRVSLDIEFSLNSDGEMDIVCTNPPNKVAKAIIESNINDMFDEVYTEDVFDEYFDAIGEFLPNSLYRRSQNSFSELVRNIKLTYPALAYSGFEDKLKVKLGIKGI